MAIFFTLLFYRLRVSVGAVEFGGFGDDVGAWGNDEEGGA